MRLRWLLIDVRALGILRPAHAKLAQRVLHCAEQLHHVCLHAVMVSSDHQAPYSAVQWRLQSRYIDANVSRCDRGEC